MKEVFAKASQAGYDGVQLTIRDVTDYDLEEMKSLMQEYNLTISAMATGRMYTVDGLSLGAGDEAVRQAAVERMCRLADFSVELGCRPALVIGANRGLTKDAATPEEYYAQFDKSILEMLSYCRPLNVPVILEVNDHLETDVYYDLEETMAYVRKVNDPGLIAYLDTMHLYYEGLDPAEVIRTYGKESYQIDISGENRLAPMDSVMDFAEIMKAVKDSGFDGWLTFEIPPEPPVELEYIKGLL